MFKILSQPFPTEASIPRHLRQAALIGLFVGVFLFAFQPFGLNLWETPHKLAKLLGFGVITFLITAINFIVWPLLFPKLFDEERWTVGRQILTVMVNILLIAVANRVYLAWLINEEKSGIGWLSMLVITFLVGLFPVTGTVLFSYIRQLKKYSSSAAELSSHTPHLPEPTNLFQEEQPTVLPDQPVTGLLTLVAENEKDVLTLPPADLLFIESSDNYCTVVYLKNDRTGQSQPTKPLLRSSLSRLEGQIKLPHVVRCHRSYIVNLDRVERVTGNAQGYKLHLLDGQFQIPVARKYNDTLVAELKAL
ncbi:LytTR family transcriptional regulator [Spirosoma sp. RP8]|uniref:LytTR family transcriptional regulator n=1 Tax=Spirosoma liriopis TaxID=2937440 RepID=A0ABT0HHS6_9BACT|nr:LytTR family DNA-binding domain-containing protein [Spirosoma liriopis]MCK8491712.1 LytTR family transcriptional regulator [Spirosoma liriopis]